MTDTEDDIRYLISRIEQLETEAAELRSAVDRLARSVDRLGQELYAK